MNDFLCALAPRRSQFAAAFAAAAPCGGRAHAGIALAGIGLRRCVALLLLLSTTLYVAPARAQGVAPSAQTLAETRQLLDWLGISALVDQVPLALTNSLETETRQRQANAQQAALWKRQLVSKYKVPALQQELLRYVAERYQADAFQRANHQLQEPLARRIRFFELATAQPSAVRGLRDFREELKRLESKREGGEKLAARRELVRALDEAAGTSVLAAALQTYIDESVRRSAGAEPSSPELLRAEMIERQRYLASFTEDYLLYAYRYLRDEELAAYRDLLGDTRMQWLLDVCRQGLIATLQNAD